jgi:hypothetical protein
MPRTCRPTPAIDRPALLRQSQQQQQQQQQQQPPQPQQQPTTTNENNHARVVVLLRDDRRAVGHRKGDRAQLHQRRHLSSHNRTSQYRGTHPSLSRCPQYLLCSCCCCCCCCCCNDPYECFIASVLQCDPGVKAVAQCCAYAVCVKRNPNKCCMQAHPCFIIIHLSPVNEKRERKRERKRKNNNVGTFVQADSQPSGGC